MRATNLSAVSGSNTAEIGSITTRNLPLPFLPTERVWIMSDDRRAIETHVVRIEIDLRSALTDRYVPQQRITYILDHAVKRTETEVFATKEALLSSL